MTKSAGTQFVILPYIDTGHEILFYDRPKTNRTRKPGYRLFSGPFCIDHAGHKINMADCYNARLCKPNMNCSSRLFSLAILLMFTVFPFQFSKQLRHSISIIRTFVAFQTLHCRRDIQSTTQHFCRHLS